VIVAFLKVISLKNWKKNRKIFRIIFIMKKFYKAISSWTVSVKSNDRKRRMMTLKGFGRNRRGPFQIFLPQYLLGMS
jgi:hypothetical protein